MDVIHAVWCGVVWCGVVWCGVVCCMRVLLHAYCMSSTLYCVVLCGAALHRVFRSLPVPPRFHPALFPFPVSDPFPSTFSFPSPSPVFCSPPELQVPGPVDKIDQRDFWSGARERRKNKRRMSAPPSISPAPLQLHDGCRPPTPLGWEVSSGPSGQTVSEDIINHSSSRGWRALNHRRLFTNAYNSLFLGSS